MEAMCAKSSPAPSGLTAPLSSLTYTEMWERWNYCTWAFRELRRGTLAHLPQLAWSMLPSHSGHPERL